MATVAVWAACTGTLADTSCSQHLASTFPLNGQGLVSELSLELISTISCCPVSKRESRDSSGETPGEYFVV